MVMIEMVQKSVPSSDTPNSVLMNGVKSGGVQDLSQSVHEQDPYPEIKRKVFT